MNEKTEKALRIVIEKLNGLNYVLIGSVSLCIQGTDLQPRDIDILTDPDGIDKIIGILKEYQTKEKYFDKSDGRNSYRTFFDIGGVEIEALGNVNSTCRPKDSLDKKIFVDYKDMKIPCMSLEEELRAYEKMGRDDKVKLIRERLKRG